MPAARQVCNFVWRGWDIEAFVADPYGHPVGVCRPVPPRSWRSNIRIAWEPSEPLDPPVRPVALVSVSKSPHEGERILRVPEVLKRTGLGRTTLWQLERDGLFPKRVKLSGSRGRAVGYRASEVARWIAEREAARKA